MAITRFSVKPVAPDYLIRRRKDGVSASSGIAVQKVATAIYDTAANDSSGVSNKTIAAHGLGVYIPSGAIVTRAWYQVKTTFTSATDAGTIAIEVQSANDVVSAIAISDVSNPWDAGFKAGIEDGTVTHMLSTTAERELTATVAVEALTAGKLVLFVEYIPGL